MTWLKQKEMIKKTLIFTFLVIVVHSAYSQSEIMLENYFRTLKSIKVEIGGKPYDFLFDSGGGLTFISPEIANDMDKEVYGNFVGFRMSGEKIETKLCDSITIGIGGRNFFHPYLGVFDIMSLLPEEFKRVDGLISLKTFENEIISLNLKENKLLVETEKSYLEKIKNMSLVESQFASGPNGGELTILTGILYKNHYWWFLFDTGNIAQTKISEHTAKEWGIDPKNESETSGPGEFTFELAGDSISVPIAVDEIIYDGALSFDFINQSVYTISFKEEKLWKSTSAKNK